MAAIKGEEGLLKLVHPGRYVEIRKEPITAAEVLKNNPRHSVTRPDVFDYPWIVVRPESVLKLGRVFYIVPNRKIYQLIKAKGYSVQPSSQPNQSPKSHVHRQLHEHASPSKRSAGGTPKHEDHCHSDWQHFQATGWKEESPQEQAGCERFDRASEFESLGDMITKYQIAYNEFKKMSRTDPTSYIESVDNKEYNFREVSSSKAAGIEQDDALGTECKKLVLKPCLRKHDSTRKLLNLKVSFVLPTNCEERNRKVTEPTAESPVFFAC